jgi:hypothetical protein
MWLKLHCRYLTQLLEVSNLLCIKSYVYFKLDFDLEIKSCTLIPSMWQAVDLGQGSQLEHFVGVQQELQM